MKKQVFEDIYQGMLMNKIAYTLISQTLICLIIVFPQNQSRTLQDFERISLGFGYRMLIVF